MEFRQQFGIDKLYVCTKFRSNKWRDFGSMTQKSPQKFGVKSGVIQKRL